MLGDLWKNVNRYVDEKIPAGPSFWRLCWYFWLLFDDVFDSKIYDFGSQFVRDNRKQLEGDEAYWINGSETKKVKLVSGL